MSDQSEIAQRKRALRASLREARTREAQQNPKAGEALAFRFPDHVLAGRGEVVAGYAPMRDEIEPGGVMARCRAAGARLALPAAERGEGPLQFRIWAFGDPLIEDDFGVRAPSPDAEETFPDLVLVPLLGFDHFGGRIGYGAGHYDRTLAALRAKKSIVAAGLAYEVQRVARIPSEPHDQALDWIVTESAAYEVFDGR